MESKRLFSKPKMVTSLFIFAALTICSSQILYCCFNFSPSIGEIFTPLPDRFDEVDLKKVLDLLSQVSSSLHSVMCCVVVQIVLLSSVLFVECPRWVELAAAVFSLLFSCNLALSSATLNRLFSSGVDDILTTGRRNSFCSQECTVAMCQNRFTFFTSLQGCPDLNHVDLNQFKSPNKNHLHQCCFITIYQMIIFD